MYGVYQTYYHADLLSSYSESDISWVGSVQAFLLFVVSAVSGPLFDLGYLRVLLVLGTFLIVAGMMITSICKSYWEIFLSQGIMIGVGDGCLFLCSVVIVGQYFTTKKAFATGIASTGSSLGQ